MQTNYGEKYKLVHIFVQSGSTTIAWQSSRVQLNQSGKSVIHHIPLQCKWWIHLSQLSLVHCAKPFWACMTQPGLYDWIKVNPSKLVQIMDEVFDNFDLEYSSQESGSASGPFIYITILLLWAKGLWRSLVDWCKGAGGHTCTVQCGVFYGRAMYTTW